MARSPPVNSGRTRHVLLLPFVSSVCAPAGCLEGFPRQTNGKLTSLPDAGTRRNHVSPVQLHKVAHQCETDAELRFGARSRFIRLPEQIEYVRQGVRTASPLIRGPWKPGSEASSAAPGPGSVVLPTNRVAEA